MCTLPRAHPSEEGRGVSGGNSLVQGPVRGFTIVELLMGLVIMTFVLLALMGLMTAVGNSWKASEDEYAVERGSRQSLLKINSILRSARYVGLTTSDSEPTAEDPAAGETASVMFWKEDKNKDGVMQVAEVAVLEHDRSNESITEYEYTGTDAASQTPFTEADIADTTDRELFKKLAAVKARVLAHHVAKAHFKATPAGDAARKQLVELRLKLKKGTEARHEFSTTALRGPRRPLEVTP